MASRFACRSYKPCPILQLARALHSLSLLCLCRLAVCNLKLPDMKLNSMQTYNELIAVEMIPES